MSTETCIIPEGKDRERDVRQRLHYNTLHPSEAVLQRCAVPLISDVQFYIPLFNQVSGEEMSKDKAETRYITTNIIIKDHSELNTRNQ